MNLPIIRKIYIDIQVKDSIIVQNIQKNLQKYPIYHSTVVEVIDDYREIQKKYQNLGMVETKDVLLVHPFEGKFIHTCPGSDGMACCHYFVINFGLNCSFDCSYCYLQSYLNSPLLTLFGNIDTLLEQVHEKITKQPHFHWRVGTGEYTDSLALDHLTEFNRILVPFFSKLPNATLELKSKSNTIHSLLDLSHNNHTIISWSINPNVVVETFEHLTSSITERLIAAQEVTQKGYSVAFHIDPIIWYPAWEKDYHALIDLVADYVDPAYIKWISLGSFRYTAKFKKTVNNDTINQLFQAEMFPSSDGKLRYLAPQRAKMYCSIHKKLKIFDKNLNVYLCMETQEMWQRVFGFMPSSRTAIEKQLASTLEKF